MSTGTVRRLVALLVVLVVVQGALVVPAQAANPNPGILPPKSKSHGATYSEWSARWLQWAYSQPVAENPVTDTTGEFCDQGQSGSVWFLAGTFFDPAADPPPPSVTRECTIPTGKAVFFPVLNAGWYTSISDEAACLAAGYASVEECATDALKGLMDWLLLNRTELRVTIDGVEVDLMFADDGVTSPYRVQAPQFEMLLPLDNVFGVPEDSCPLVDGMLDCQPYFGDGIYLMLAPLSAGSYELVIDAGSYFDVTYNLTVQGGKPTKTGSSPDEDDGSTLDANALAEPEVLRPAVYLPLLTAP